MEFEGRPFRTRHANRKYREEEKRFRSNKNQNLLAKAGCHDFVLVLDGLKPTFNIGKIFRLADIFGCRAIHLVGIPFFDTAPAKGAFKHVPAKFHEDARECIDQLKKDGYRFFALDPEAKNSLGSTDLPKKAAFVLGHEEYGISPLMKKHDELEYLRIPQFGKSQSLNVSNAAAIAIWEYLRQHGDLTERVESEPNLYL